MHNMADVWWPSFTLKCLIFGHWKLWLTFEAQCVSVDAGMFWDTIAVGESDSLVNGSTSFWFAIDLITVVLCG